MTRIRLCGALSPRPSGKNEENSMSLSSRLQELQKKHETLSRKVEVAQRSPGHNDLEIGEMKKRKLKLKEEIERIQMG